MHNSKDFSFLSVKYNPSTLCALQEPFGLWIPLDISYSYFPDPLLELLEDIIFKVATVDTVAINHCLPCCDAGLITSH